MKKMTRRIRSFLLYSVFLFPACKNTDKTTTESENNIDAARNFIRAALDGKFEQARQYLLPDSTNTNWMDVAERSYQRSEQTVKDGYRTASINIHKVTEVNDSTTVLIYSNSYKNDHDTLKVLKQNGRWLVDLKYLFEHDADSLGASPALRDTIR